MKGYILSIVQLVQLVTHVLEKQSILLRVALKTSFQQAENELYTAHRYHSSLVYINDVPSVLEIPDVCIGEQGILLVGVEQGKVLHDDSCSLKEIWLQQRNPTGELQDLTH